MAFDPLEDAKEALLKLELHRVDPAVALVRQEVGVPRTRAAAMHLFEALRIEFFVRLETEPASGRHFSLAEEINQLVGLRGTDEQALVPRGAASWLRGWMYEVQLFETEAFMYRLAACRHMRARARDLAAQPVWRHSLEGVEASLMADCLADLARSLRRVREPHGPMRHQRTAFTLDQLARSPILDLLDHQDMNLWAVRRTRTRLGFEAADRGERSLALEHLIKARDILPNRTPLALLEEPLIALEVHIAEKAPACDHEYVRDCYERARQNFSRHGFVRRFAALEAMWPAIERRCITNLSR